MRLSDRERERCFDELARHAAAGRLDVAELERRVAVIDGALTHEEVLGAFADLPAAPLGAAGSGPAGLDGPGTVAATASRPRSRARGGRGPRS